MELEMFLYSPAQEIAAVGQIPGAVTMLLFSSRELLIGHIFTFG